MTAVYGFDGPLIVRIRSLDEAIPPAGWEMPGAARPSWKDLDGTASAQGKVSHRTRWMADRRVTLRWQPTAALGYPPGGEGTPPWGRMLLAPSMWVTWSSRGQEKGWRRDPNKTRSTNRNYLAVEISEAEVPELLDEALAGHEHALTITLHLAYYSNPNAKAWPHRIPHYLLPDAARPLGGAGAGS